MSTSAYDELRAMFAKGLINDLFLAEEAYELYKTIGENCDEVNRSQFAGLFARLQMTFAFQFTVSITKLYERPGRRFDIISIPSVLDFVEVNVTELPIQEPFQFRRKLASMGVDVQKLKDSSDLELSQEAVRHFRDTLPSLETVGLNPISKALQVLKGQRDKILVHREKMPQVGLPQASWNDAYSLVKYAQDFVAAIGWGYLSWAYDADDGRYILSDDVKAQSRMLLKLLKQAGIVVGK